MKKSFVCALLCMFIVVLTGCNSLQELNRAKPADVSPFLPQPELLVKQKATFPFHYFYLKKNPGVYENAYIAPVNTEFLKKNTNWAKVDQKVAASLGSDIQKLAKFTRNEFAKAFTEARGPHTLKVVDSPDADGNTVIISIAIVTIVPTKAELVVLGTAANLFLPGIGVVANAVAAGSVTIECVVRDAKTNEIIAMFANTEKDQKAVLNIAGMTWYTSAENNIKKQAQHTAKVFSGSDYTYTYRRLIKIIEF